MSQISFTEVHNEKNREDDGLMSAFDTSIDI